MMHHMCYIRILLLPEKEREGALKAHKPISKIPLKWYYALGNRCQLVWRSVNHSFAVIFVAILEGNGAVFDRSRSWG